MNSGLRVIVGAINHGNANISVRGVGFYEITRGLQGGSRIQGTDITMLLRKIRTPRVTEVLAGVMVKFQGGNQGSHGGSHFGVPRYGAWNGNKGSSQSNKGNGGGSNGLRACNNCSQRGQMR